MKYLLAILVLLPFLISAQNISVSSFSLRQNDMDARVNSPKLDQNGEKCAIIKVVTTQQGFVWEGDALGIVDAPYKTSEYWLYVPHGAKKLTIKHPQLGMLRDYIYPIPIKEATVYEMVLTTGKVTTVVEDMETPMQWIAIESSPDGAEVYINDQHVGNTPYTKKLEVGKYNYRIEKSMYHSQAGVLALSAEKAETLSLTMKPNFGYANITSKPESGASIELDSRPINGTTPHKTYELLSGTHKVTVKKPMFKSKTVEFKVNDGETTEVIVNLDANFATVNITTSPLAEIIIDDESKGNGTYTGRLMPGLHTFEGKKDKHTTYKTQIELYAGEQKDISLYPTPKTGSVDIASSPFGATIFVDGIEKGKTPITLKDLLIGKYHIDIKKKGFSSFEEEILIEENKVDNILAKLESSSKIFISSKPTGATISINGVEMGITPDSLNLPYGRHLVSLTYKDNINQQYLDIVAGSQKDWIFDMSGKTGGFIDPRDSILYQYIRIGDQVWMAESLIATKLNNYKDIELITDFKKWDNATSPMYCWYKNDSISAIKKGYGALYNYAVISTEKLCPVGWHIPNNIEWEELEDYLTINGFAYDTIKYGKKATIAKSLASQTGWDNRGKAGDVGEDLKLNNLSGFTAVPSGSRSSKHGDNGSGYDIMLWSSTKYSGRGEVRFGLYANRSTTMWWFNSEPTYGGYSVRCLKDYINGEDVLKLDNYIKVTKSYQPVQKKTSQVNKNVNDNTVTDIDGNKYKTIKIGEQTWMAENLKVTRFPDGSEIKLTENYNNWKNMNDGVAMYYNNDEFGANYTYQAARNACPTGWHLPSDNEWNQLSNYVINEGNFGTEAMALKAKNGWKRYKYEKKEWIETGNGSDKYGFAAIPNGRNKHNGSYNPSGHTLASWWTSTECYNKYAYFRLITDKNSIFRDYGYKSTGCAVRCIKDNN